MSRLEAIKVREITAEEESPRRLMNQQQAEEAMAAAREQQAIATNMLMTAIKAMSQRFVVALSNLFTLLTAASAFYLWMIALPEVSTLQIVACSLYSLFILALNVYGRRK